MHNKTLLRGHSLLFALPFFMLQISSGFADQAPGGFAELPSSANARAVLSPGRIQGFLPQRGAFEFPAPYNTQASRITNSADCSGNDCVNYAGYSYWRNMNNHVGMESMLIFLGLDATRGGKGPSLFELNKSTGAVRDLGALFPSSHRLGWATGEGWYFSATMPTKLYINDGPRISRFDVITSEMTTVADISRELGSGFYLTQMHSSDNDQVHSATVREDSSYRALGCMAYEERNNRYHYYPIAAEFDECQIDRSGEWLLIKANLDGRDGEDNLIVEIRSGNQRVLLDRDGAAGHSDMGHGYMIAADNWASEANTWKLWDFTKPQLRGEVVYSNNDWSVEAPAHVSHTNARSGTQPQQQYACGSSVNRNNAVHANEIVCLTLDGSGKSVVVAPTMTNLNASGGGDDYARFAKGNLDVTGRYFLWTSNMGGSRLDVFVVEIPDHLLTAAEKPRGNNNSGNVNGNAGAVIPVSPDPAIWHETSNVSSQGKLITKTSGCDGCADAGVVSVQYLTNGKATLEFTAQSYEPLFFAGFTREQSIPSAADIVFGLRLQNGVAEVRERDNYRGDTPFRSGDRFTITIDAGRVIYARNGTTFYTSESTIRYPLYAGSALYNIGAALENVVLKVAISK